MSQKKETSSAVLSSNQDRDSKIDFPSPHSEDLPRGKGKRKREEEGGCEAVAEHRPVKRRHSEERLDQPSEPVEQTDLVDFWVQNDCQWSDFLKETTMTDDKSQGSQKKRSRSESNSYRQSTISGDKPKAWGGKHAAVMLETGIFMEKQKDADIAEEDRELLNQILQAEHDLPNEWSFQGENFSTILSQVLYRNERRVLRDVGPHVMPSPELLNVQGHPGLEHIAEAIDAQWTKCTSLCGPKSRPDVTHGLSRSVFTHEEREKLVANNTCACETMMFPFYICEAKCFDKSIEESELQALHAASVAGNAVIEIYQRISAAEELHRRVLAFSVSHNQRLVKIFAHFVLIQGNGKITFHRHKLFEADLLDDANNRHRPYQIALGIWERFYPVHLERIRNALQRQQCPPKESFTALPLGEEEQQSLIGEGPVSQTQNNNSNLLVKLQEENARLVKRVLEQQDEFREHQIQSAHHLDRQREESREELKQVLRRMDQQAEHHKEQMDQQKEIIALLKESRS